MTLLTKEQQEELQQLIHEISTEAQNVVGDYTKTPSEDSGSVVHIHIDSPFLGEK